MLVQEQELFHSFNNLNSLRHSLSAGEPLNPEVIRIWKNLTNLDVYGML